MGISKDTAAKRMTEVPKDITAQLVNVDSQGKRGLYEFNADKYGTVKVRVYLPETVKASALNGIVLDYDVEGVLAEDVDSLDRARKLRARSVLTFDGNKHAGFEVADNDHFEDTALVVLDFPDWATVETLTLAA
jgi:hypothetical protein